MVLITSALKKPPTLIPNPIRLPLAYALGFGSNQVVIYIIKYSKALCTSSSNTAHRLIAVIGLIKSRYSTFVEIIRLFPLRYMNTVCYNSYSVGIPVC